MNKSLPLLALLLLLWPLSALHPGSFSLEKLREDERFFQSLYPRLEGSAQEREAIAYIEQRLQETGIEWQRYDASEADTFHTFSATLEAVVPGRLADSLVLAVPLNQPLDSPSAGDGSINLALALSLLEQARQARPPVTLRVLFLGAEFGDGPGYPLGSRMFLRDFYPEYPVMALYLNLRALPSRLIIRSASHRIAAPYWIIEQTTESLEKAGLYFLVRGNENQVFRIGLTSEHTIIEPFLAAGYPALCFEGEYAPLPDTAPAQWLESFHDFFSTFLESSAGGIPEAWDRHYLFFQARSFYLIVDEQTYLVLLLAVLGGVFLYATVYTERVRKYVRTIGRRLWSLPVIYLLGFGVLLLSTWALQGLLALRRLETLWMELPLPFLAFKLTLALLILVLLRRPLRRLPFSRNGSFYSASALIYLFANIVVLAVFNISFTYYFLWAFVLATLFAVTPHKPLKLLFFLAAPYWLVKTLVELFALPQLDFCRLVLLSTLGGNLLLTTSLLPFVLMLIRIEMVIPSLARIPRRTRFRLAAALLGLGLGALGLRFALYNPYDELRGQPVAAEYTMDLSAGTSHLDLSSPAPLGRLTVLENDRPLLIETTSSRYQTPLSFLPEPPVVGMRSTDFLDRRNVVFRFQPHQQPHRIRLRLSGDAAFVLYDANFPYQRSPEGREYDILIGRNPPVPLNVQLTLPRHGAYRLNVVLEYRGLPAHLRVEGRNIRLEPRHSIRQSIEL